MTVNRQGCTRIVILTKKYAIKIPNFLDGWRLFLHGLINNMRESSVSKLNFKGYCPVLFSIAGGWLIVMPKVKIMTREEWDTFDLKEWRRTIDFHIEIEIKECNFGFLNGEAVTVDYGLLYF